MSYCVNTFYDDLYKLHVHTKYPYHNQLCTYLHYNYMYMYMYMCMYIVHVHHVHLHTTCAYM